MGHNIFVPEKQRNRHLLILLVERSAVDPSLLPKDEWRRVIRGLWKLVA
jgi:hypothetical protein